MQAVVALPSSGEIANPKKWRQAMFRPIAGVPLLVRVLATAARTGVRSVLIVHPLHLDSEWLRAHLRSPLLSGLTFRLVPADRNEDPVSAGDWRRLTGDLDETFLWLPWNAVMLKKTLSAVTRATGPDGDGRSATPEPVRSTPPAAGVNDGAMHAPALVDKATLVGPYEGRLLSYLSDIERPGDAPVHGSWVGVNSDATARAAEQLLIQGSGKSSDGIYSNFNRRLCRPAVRWLLKTPVTANMVSLIAIPVVALAGYFYARGYWAAYVAGSLIHFASVLLDEIDGMLARTKFSESPFGTWLDTMSDYLGYLFLWVGMSVGLWRQYGDPVWLLLGAVTLVLSVLVFMVLIRQRRRVSTPNAFNTQLMARLEADSTNIVSRLIRLLAFLPRKAVMSHYVVWFSLLGLLPLLVSLAALGSVVTFGFVVYSNRFFRRVSAA